MGRVIGRVLSLGYSMPGVLVDNYTVLSAPSFFDYDAMVVDPKAAGELIEGVLGGEVEARTFSGQLVRAQAEGAGEVTLSSVLARRRDETARLLERGGAVIVFAHPAVSHTIPGGESVDDYWWLPLQPGVAMAPPLLLPGEGSQAQVVDWEHPLAGFVSSQAANIAYRAHFATRAIEGAITFAASAGGGAIGVEIPVARGRLIFLPALKAPPSGDARYAASEKMQAGIRRAVGAMAPGRAPTWTAAQRLPGQEERERRVTEARASLAAAERDVAAAEQSLEEVAGYQRLLWQEGPEGLTPAVVDALKLIGCEVNARHPAEMELRCAEGFALFDVEGSEHPIDMAPHHRLRQRIERAIERHGRPMRGVLFVNGERLAPPAQRRHISDGLRVASETMRYAVAPTCGLYEAVAQRMAGDVEAVAAYRARLFSTDGLLT